MLFAKPVGYKFTLQIDGNTDSIMLLCYYHAQYQYKFDTAYNNGKGKFVFESNRELPPGLYRFDNAKGRYVDFVIYHEEPRFKFHTENTNWMLNMTVSGSKENTLFYNFHRATNAIYDEVVEAEHRMDSADFLVFRQQAKHRVDSIRYKTMEEHPHSMLCMMMKATLPPAAPPDSIKGNDAFFWYMHHYFDNMPLDDDFIIRTPSRVFYQSYSDYVDKHMQGLSPAMIIPLLDTLIDRAEPAPEVQHWLILNLTEKYLQSNIMVYDEIYVHLVQRYFATGKADFLSPSIIDEQIERANKWERLLVGREAPELILLDTTSHAFSLHHMPGRYTLLLFWSPTCGHCREIIPAIYKVFDRVADSLNMTAFAILTEPDESTIPKWKKFLADHHMTNRRWVNLNGGEANIDWREVYDVQTTPQIYLIENKEHRFIAKKMNADLLEQIIKQLK